MQITFSRWGNSLAVRIPSAFARGLGIGPGDRMELLLEDGRLVLRPLEPHYDLATLVAEIAPENRPGEVDTGGTVGNEAW
ncbi:MAG TPA: AbrB/MazE/SpoVT family DNA-binding domain-containing protein [Alphaproteobacteria bacterium]|nr:AbrB/MazE/SpoVT family DNA-binding domain-containing protein [Alphaproteobacteria bacterium]